MQFLAMKMAAARFESPFDCLLLLCCRSDPALFARLFFFRKPIFFGHFLRAPLYFPCYLQWTTFHPTRPLGRIRAKASAATNAASFQATKRRLSYQTG